MRTPLHPGAQGPSGGCDAARGAPRTRRRTSRLAAARGGACLGAALPTPTLRAPPAPPASPGCSEKRPTTDPPRQVKAPRVGGG